MKQDNDSTTRRASPRGEVTAAALLALGVLIKRFHAPRAWLAAVPIVAVNSVAFYGQLSYLNVHPGIPSGIRLLMAAALESVAIYYAWQAHLAQLADDASLRLALTAYAVAMVIGAMNYSHFCAPGWRPTFLAVAFAGASVLSPAMWGTHSRRVSRDKLRATGDIEPHAVRLGKTRWGLHPLRACRVMFRATWPGVTRVDEALALPAIKDQDRRQAPAPQTSSPGVPGREPARKPRPAVVAARTEPAAAARSGLPAMTLGELKSDQERDLVQQLITSGKPLPGINSLSRAERIGAEKARRVLGMARSQMNGHGSADHG